MHPPRGSRRRPDAPPADGNYWCRDRALRSSPRRDRALDGRFAQTAGRGDALAEPDDAGERIHHTKAVAGRTRHQQAAIIGAEIERGIGRTTPIAGKASIGSSRRPPTPREPPLRRPANNGVEAWGVPGLAAHNLNLPAAPGPPPGAPQLRQCSLGHEKCNSARAARNPCSQKHWPRKLFLWKRPACFIWNIPPQRHHKPRHG